MTVIVYAAYFSCCCLRNCRENKDQPTEVIEDNCCQCNLVALKKLSGLKHLDLVYVTYHVDVSYSDVILHDDIVTHQCLLPYWAFVRGNHGPAVDFTHKRADDVSLKNLLIKQSSCQWFDMLCSFDLTVMMCILWWLCQLGDWLAVCKEHWFHCRKSSDSNPLTVKSLI